MNKIEVYAPEITYTTITHFSFNLDSYLNGLKSNSSYVINIKEGEAVSMITNEDFERLNEEIKYPLNKSDRLLEMFYGGIKTGRNILSKKSISLKALRKNVDSYLDFLLSNEVVIDVEGKIFMDTRHFNKLVNIQFAVQERLKEKFEIIDLGDQEYINRFLNNLNK